MILEVDEHTVVVFDLDDTLYQEIDFLISGYRYIIYKYFTTGHDEMFNQMMLWYSKKNNVFSELLSFFQAQLNQTEYSIAGLISSYRNHFPQINPNPGSKKLIDLLLIRGCKLGLITDGRSITQRNKIKALGLDQKFDLEIISEEFGSDKPDYRNFHVFHEKFPNTKKFVYIGDNPAKDFITPNTLGWRTICLIDKGNNIHRQNFNYEKLFLPQYTVHSLSDIHI